MGETRKAQKGETMPRQAAEDRTIRDMSDPREDDGWTQPESSAQKGAEKDDSEG